MILGTDYGTVEDIEILWTLIAATGLIYSILNIGEARKDWKYIQEHDIRNGRRIVGKIGYYSELCRAIIQGIFLSIGLLALVLPSPPPAADLPLEQVAIGFMVRWGLITASCLLTFKSWLSRKARREIEGEH